MGVAMTDPAITARTWTDWARTLLPHVVQPVARVLIDGRSGSGKSTLAAQLVSLAAEIGTAVQCVHVEDMYPGWDGLDAGSRAVVTEILEPLRAGGQASWQTYDWHAAGPGPHLHVDAASPLIIEGTGALTRASAALATFTIWVDADESFRQSRAFARDGDIYRPHWQRWADQEDRLLAHEDSPALAAIVIDAAAIEATTMKTTPIEDVL